MFPIDRGGEVWRAGDYEGVSDWADEDNGEGPILTIYYWLAGSFVVGGGPVLDFGGDIDRL